jgi:hypothetical protein
MSDRIEKSDYSGQQFESWKRTQNKRKSNPGYVNDPLVILENWAMPAAERQSTNIVLIAERNFGKKRYVPKNANKA